MVCLFFLVRNCRQHCKSGEIISDSLHMYTGTCLRSFCGGELTPLCIGRDHSRHVEMGNQQVGDQSLAWSSDEVFYADGMFGNHDTMLVEASTWLLYFTSQTFSMIPAILASPRGDHETMQASFLRTVYPTHRTTSVVSDPFRGTSSAKSPHRR